MYQKMKSKINHNHIYIAIFASFLFFWGVNLNFIRDLTFLNFDSKSRDFLSNFRISYLIIFLVIPILYKFIKEKSLSPNIIFNYQKYVIFFVIFVAVHFFFIKIYYNEIIDKSEILNLSYLLFISIIYCHFRNFIFINFKKIIIFYLAIFIIYSVYEGSQIYNNVGQCDDDILLISLIQEEIKDPLVMISGSNVGQCNNDILLISLIQKYLNISLSNSIYLENSHLAMMTIAVFFSTLYILIQEKKYNIILFLLFSIEVIIVLNNLSTTFFVGYFFSQIALLLFFIKKIDPKYWIISIIFLFFNSYIFLSDKNCTTKITDFKAKDVAQNNLQKGDKNITTLIYQRSIIVAKETLLHHSLGWGIDGMDNANKNLLKNYKDCEADNCDGMYDKDANWEAFHLNLKDGLSNSLKLFTEFGFFAFIIYFYFFKYILNIKNINSYNLFIIVLFITMSIRGAGYFNGGFIFCLLEFFFHKKLIKN
jgi:hypothetical protein